MLYINDATKPHYKYDDVVDLAIKNGIKAKRAFIYLAGLGVKGVFCRIQSKDSLSYLEPVKVAVIEDRLVTKVSTCTKCKGLVIE